MIGKVFGPRNGEELDRSARGKVKPDVGFQGLADYHVDKGLKPGRPIDGD